MLRRNNKLLTTAFTVLVLLIFTEISADSQNNSYIIPLPQATLFKTPQGQTLSATDSTSLFIVTKVIDGDTIEVSDQSGLIPQQKYKIRYIGIDTPENTIKRECFGKESSNKNKELILGKVVRLEKDISETDRFGRLLRYVYEVDPERPGGVEGFNGSDSINNQLVRSGFAQAITYPPDVKYQDLFLESQNYAKENNLGLWGICS